VAEIQISVHTILVIILFIIAAIILLSIILGAAAPQFGYKFCVYVQRTLPLVGDLLEKVTGWCQGVVV
jgi:hypothetical protein